MSSTSEQPTSKISDEERDLYLAVARALWTLEAREREFSDPESRRAAFAKERKDYFRKARTLVRMLESKGLEFRRIPGAGEDASAD